MTSSLFRSLLSSYRACAVVTAALLLVTNVRLAAGEPDSASRIAALRDSFRYTPGAPIETTLVPTDEPLIVLDVLTITESMSRRALATQIEDRWARESREAFTWLKGGHIATRMVGKFQADTGAWVTLGDRANGINPSRELFIKVEVLRLKW